MTKTRKYILSLGSAVLILLLFHQLLAFSGLFPLNFRIALLGNIALGLIFSTGMLIIYPALKKPASEFVGRFMMLTTIQLLEVLSLVTFFIFKKVPLFKLQAFHTIGLFVLLLSIQSVLLVRQVRK